jgi:hypothetical protein
MYCTVLYLYPHTARGKGNGSIVLIYFAEYIQKATQVNLNGHILPVVLVCAIARAGVIAIHN